jgi:two-component system copper resistance phosphate regulon response regulator CusR
MRVLIVEDDSQLSADISKGLQTAGFQVSTASSARDAAQTLKFNEFDSIVLDLMLPGEDGLSFCRSLRLEGVNVPIMMLTARDAVEDLVAGLEAGADDYLKKPFALQELIARLRALGRRRSLLQRVIKVADLEVDLASKRARRGGKTIELTAKEFSLLECLALHPEAVLDRGSITAHVWDENHDAFTNVLEVLVGRLRRKIDSGFDMKLIHTMRGAGYRLGV